MGLLESISTPRDLRALTDDQLIALASEIRDLMVATCARTGGHLGPNLGVVELTMAIHRVFDIPRDRVVFDTGHQAYVHKLLTGRAAGFDGLRQEGGLSGYPSQAESEHDIVENSHASTALSYADGLAKAYAIRGEDRHVVAVIGDGALTGGMAWEALNNIAIAQGQQAGDRRQRQRPLLHPHHRRSGHRARRRCAPTRATSRCSTWSSSASPRSRASAPRPTTCCTRSRRA